MQLFFCQLFYLLIIQLFITEIVFFISLLFYQLILEFILIFKVFEVLTFPQDILQVSIDTFFLILLQNSSLRKFIRFLFLTFLDTGCKGSLRKLLLLSDFLSILRVYLNYLGVRILLKGRILINYHSKPILRFLKALSRIKYFPSLRFILHIFRILHRFLLLRINRLRQLGQPLLQFFQRYNFILRTFNFFRITQRLYSFVYRIKQSALNFSIFRINVGFFYLFFFLLESFEVCRDLPGFRKVN